MKQSWASSLEIAQNLTRQHNSIFQIRMWLTLQRMRLKKTYEYQCFPLSKSEHRVLDFYVSSTKTFISFDPSGTLITRVTLALGKILEKCLEEKIKLVEGKCPVQVDTRSCGIFVAQNMDFLFRKVHDKRSLGQASPM